ncbi:M3 family oligoendopeptidase [Acetobacter conturbans]|uniref:M3 family oligoendopeptidase n=1 Tax=Acetobacter conturbans TaxID=1737472 RepID=A0ABX0K2F3_9PROT|nr:M3 family oligoendopeptidase [Acetobacter conturbans]NHN88488.1 M3 family oligoendopeptidase [Acetobacter conturbans]
MTQTFASLTFPRPTEASLAESFGVVASLLDAGDIAGALSRFDRERRTLDSWSALVHLRFAQDTTSEKAKEDRDYADHLSPKATAHEVSIKKRLLAEPLIDRARSVVGEHVIALWKSDITTFDTRIEQALEEEAKLTSAYTALLASARIEVGGETVNLSGLAPWLEHADRSVRHKAEQARWAFFAENGATLDDLYARLVALRTDMARTLGFETYTPLGYRRMRRVDYGPEDVARFREEVATHVTPLIALLLEQRRTEMGWPDLHYWDENFIDPKGNPKPAGDYDLLIERAENMFDRMSGGLGPFFKTMVEGGYLDLKNRDSKAGGGFCTAFPDVGMPFIFANFNGTHGDISVFTHEMGHAYQNWRSRDLPTIDELWPTMEAAEINSMGLEFLTWPHMDLMVEDGAADRFRRMHLISSLSFLPYGVCVDHFQHEVYARPDMTPEERHDTWRRLEQHYMPWRDYGDLAYPAKGGRWQAQGHIYRNPLYYIDYTLALCCAMQLWLLSRRDEAAAMTAYEGLCARGGAAPFTTLIADAGLVSPFAPGALADVVREAAAELGLSAD